MSQSRNRVQLRVPPNRSSISFFIVGEYSLAKLCFATSHSTSIMGQLTMRRGLRCPHAVCPTIRITLSIRAINVKRRNRRTPDKSFVTGFMSRLWRCLIPSFCIVTLLLAPLHAQKTTGTIRGVVSDPTGAVVANVAVIVRNDGTGSVRTVNTNADGEYVAPELPSGTYTVNVKALSFKEAVSTAVELHVSSTEILNIQLQVGGASE